MIKRHHLAETMPGGPLDRTVKRTLEEAAARRQAGYKKIALAGQSFGGYVTMEAIDTSPDIDAAIAFAPGIRPAGGSARSIPASSRGFSSATHPREAGPPVAHDR